MLATILTYTIVSIGLVGILKGLFRLMRLQVSEVPLMAFFVSLAFGLLPAILVLGWFVTGSLLSQASGKSDVYRCLRKPLRYSMLALVALSPWEMPRTAGRVEQR